MTVTNALTDMKEAPYYEPVGDEVEVFTAAFDARLPVLLKGPTGCGKTRFVEAMAWKLFEGRSNDRLTTIACHEDLTATDLVGRYLLLGNETRWSDGPLTRAVRDGGLCYLDEIVEARKDTTVLIHALTDHRRILPIEKTGELVQAHDDFLLVISYNPGYQSVLKDLKPSTRQRFVSLEFDYPNAELETRIIARESGVDEALAERLATIGIKVRNLREHGFEEGVSTRLLIYTANLVRGGIEPRRAATSAIVSAIADDRTVQEAVADIVDAVLP
ncbi:MAG: CbbQ/NirQ/NorQ/GpvN family protein [Pseudomonadota bacterium]